MRYINLFTCVLLMCIVNPIYSISYAAQRCTPMIGEPDYFPLLYEDIVAGQKADAWFTGFSYSNPENYTGNKIYKVVHETLKNIYNGVFTEYVIPIKEDFGPGFHNIVLGKDNNLWFTARPDIIGRMTQTGKVTLFRTPAMASVPSIIMNGPGGIWFIEQGVNMIGRITPQGKITEFRIPHHQTTDLNITDLARGEDGNLWFIEQQTKKIGKLTPEGVVSEFALPEGQMQTPLAITLGLDGNLWFTDAQVNVVGRITLKGKITEYPFVITTDNYGGLGDIVAAADGNLWAARNANAMVSLSAKHIVVEYRLSSNSYPYSLSSGSNGTLWAIGEKIFAVNFPQSCTD